MENKNPRFSFVLKIFSYILVAVAASAVTLALWGGRYHKLTELEQMIDTLFIGEYDREEIRDAAASAMVYALSDRWSYYMSAEEYADHQEAVSNAYVGIGITIQQLEDGTGHNILEVTPGGAAQEAGILPGDILVEAQGQSVGQLTTAQLRSLIVGQVGKQVTIAVLRNDQRLEYTLTCREIRKVVASGELLEGNVGLVRISNFNSGCGEETIAAIKELLQQGATSLIFDVRNNPGGYVSEMVCVLDYLLPEGTLFQSVDYKGNESKETSDASCLEVPMAVLVNERSYSAAEFFAACLREYEWATVVGEQTTGKGYYQNTLVLTDGSAVNLSTGKYFTPQGVSLTETGGITPDVVLDVDEKTAAGIYSETIFPADDPQVQAAVQVVKKTQG